MAQRNEAGEVRAAGGVVARGEGPDLEVLLVHRGHYDDWTIPKGKAEAGESDEDCARREVEEETGLRCRLTVELPPVRYEDRLGRPKVARYWLLEVVGGEPIAQNEVDEVAWLPLDDAIARLSYERAAIVLRAAGDARRAAG